MPRKGWIRCCGACSILSVILAVALLGAAITLGADHGGIEGAVERQIDEVFPARHLSLSLYSLLPQQVTLVPGHASYEQLQNPTLPVWKDFYFFNLTNAEEFAAGAKPNVTQVGPYSYR